MKQIFCVGFLLISFHCFAQFADSTNQNKIIVHKDFRLDILANRESDINTAILKEQARIGKGYRLMILNTNDREYAMKIRGELLQKYPEQKTYMWYADPYIKIKFGNFKTKDEADVYKNQISRLLNGASIYYLSENIEVKPDKDFNPDDPN
jgi:hypothetical protein